MGRIHTALQNRKAISWAETIENHEADVVEADEVEAELEIALDAPSGGAGAVSVKRAEFQYGSVGSGNNSYGRLSPENPGSPSMKTAIQTKGVRDARSQVGNGVEHGRAHAGAIIRSLGNARRG